jgi:hypothetical protein
LDVIGSTSRKGIEDGIPSARTAAPSQALDVNSGEECVESLCGVGPPLNTRLAKDSGAGFIFGAREYSGIFFEVACLDVSDSESPVHVAGVIEEISKVADVETTIIKNVARDTETRCRAGSSGFVPPGI